ncbi:hypothetical protein J6590_041722 [Homalodisca vitripennis]|nr:hypothetical protein J6590_041722 [Homalodisca vitripennis]
MENAIQKALKLAKEREITGKAVTPFILQQVSELTEGRSLQTNISLIKNNALVGANIAVALAKTERENKQTRREEQPQKSYQVITRPKDPQLNPVRN